MILVLLLFLLGSYSTGYTMDAPPAGALTSCQEVAAQSFNTQEFVNTYYSRFVETCEQANQSAETTLFSPDGPRILLGTALTMAKIIQWYKNTQQHPTKPTIFDCSQEPSQPFVDYLLSIATQIQCSEICYLYAMIYIDRTIELPQRPLEISPYNVHKFFATALLIAIKYLEDHYFKNVFYAPVFGFSLAELNQQEFELLSLNNFRLYVSTETIKTYKTALFTSTPLATRNEQLTSVMHR